MAPRRCTTMATTICSSPWENSHISNEVQGKPPADVKLADGEARFTPGNFSHVARDLADQPFRNVTIELLQDEKLRAAPSPLGTGKRRGTTNFRGGHIKVLFTHDGARVSEVELKPGGVVPSHHHDGPHLVVAVSDPRAEQ